jgi:hypothetical protein
MTTNRAWCLFMIAADIALLVLISLKYTSVPLAAVVGATIGATLVINAQRAVHCWND